MPHGRGRKEHEIAAAWKPAAPPRRARDACASVPNPLMARKSLRPNLNQIRAWVRQGRTDAWVAHQLDVSVREIEQFKRQNDLAGEEEAVEQGSGYEEIDLRAEDDAQIAAE